VQGDVPIRKTFGSLSPIHMLLKELFLTFL